MGIKITLHLEEMGVEVGVIPLPGLPPKVELE